MTLPKKCRKANRARDEFTLAVRRALAARVGWRCSNPDCRAATSGPVHDVTRASIVGVAAHITAAAKSGPRFDPVLSAQERRSILNGIWLCTTCAKKIDDDYLRYTSSLLRYWRMDAEHLADQEKGRPGGLAAALQFAAVGVSPICLWQRSHRLGKVADRIGAMPQIGFHAIPQQAWNSLGVSQDTHSPDPVLDVTLVNNSGKLCVLSAIGFEAHAVWSDLKGLPQSYKVRVTDGYTLSCTPIDLNVPQILDLPDPIAIPAAQPMRFTLRLADFRSNLRGNECLLRLLANANGTLCRSQLINMGVY